MFLSPLFVLIPSFVVVVVRGRWWLSLQLFRSFSFFNERKLWLPAERWIISLNRERRGSWWFAGAPNLLFPIWRKREQQPMEVDFAVFSLMNRSSYHPTFCLSFLPYSFSSLLLLFLFPFFLAREYSYAEYITTLSIQSFSFWQKQELTIPRPMVADM